MSSTHDRDLACRTAPGDPERALAIARRIPDAWFRAQALAWVARYAADELVEQLAAEALQTAQESEEKYRTVAVSAWPIRALIERGRPAAAQRALDALLAIVPKVEPVASRAEALSLLWQAVFPAGAQLREPTLRTITECCNPEAHWRAARLYTCVVSTTAAESVARAEAVVAQMPEGAAKRKAAQLLQDRAASPPREFFVAAA